MTEKIFLDANSLLMDSYRLAKKILDSDFRPNFMVALWRGGAPVGIGVQEYLKYKKVKADHISIRTSAYDGIDDIKRTVQVSGIEYVVKKANAGDKLLIVDDVYDSGLSIKAVISELEKEMRANMPKNIKVATVYYKPSRNKTSRAPDYYIHETDKWLVFPHELEGLTEEELNSKDEALLELLR